MDAAEARQRLSAPDTAIIQAAAEELVRERTVEAMSYMCEAIASNDNLEVGEEILWGAQSGLEVRGSARGASTSGSGCS